MLVHFHYILSTRTHLSLTRVARMIAHNEQRGGHARVISRLGGTGHFRVYHKLSCEQISTLSSVSGNEVIFNSFRVSVNFVKFCRELCFEYCCTLKCQHQWQRRLFSCHFSISRNRTSNVIEFFVNWHISWNCQSFFAMRGRADIERSKGNVAMDA